jgi:hypothetical protein
MRIHQLIENTDNTIKLTDLYDYDELNDESEILYHWITPESETQSFTIKTMQPNDIKNLTTHNNDMTILNAYKQFADKDQKKLVKYKSKNFDHNRIIVIANNTLIDGNHHAIAAILTNNPTKYINIYEQNNINENNNNIPQYLYHATYKPYLKSIMTTGLGGNNIRKNWSDSKDNTIYLATNKDIAYDFAETSELLDDNETELLDQIIILKINTTLLDKNKIIKDTNINYDNDNEEIYSYEYKGIIPPKHISIM